MADGADTHWMINTYNESPLHAALKELYAAENGGKTEQVIEGSCSIADVLLPDGSVIEIQTGSISALSEKISCLISKNRKVTIVRPVAIEKTIVTVDGDGNVLSKKRSPKRETVYSVFRGMTKLAGTIPNDLLTIEVAFVRISETRLRTDEPAQLANRSRRHLRKWIPLGKNLVSIEGKKTLRTEEDYLSLIPASVKEPFTAKEIAEAILDFGTDPFSGEPLTAGARKDAARGASPLLWLLRKCGIAVESDKKGRSKSYAVRKKS